MHEKNITNVSTSTSGTDEALKWNNDSRSQPSVNCWAATCFTLPKLMQAALVRQKRSLREKVTGWSAETGSGCRGLFELGSFADATQSWYCPVSLALGWFTKQLEWILVSLHALKISSETQDDRGYWWLSRWHSPFWVRADTTAWCWRTLLLDKIQWDQEHWQFHTASLQHYLLSYPHQILIENLHPADQSPSCSCTASDVVHNVPSKNLYINSKSLLYFSLEMTATIHS